MLRTGTKQELPRLGRSRSSEAQLGGTGKLQRVDSQKLPVWNQTAKVRRRSLGNDDRDTCASVRLPEVAPTHSAPLLRRSKSVLVGLPVTNYHAKYEPELVFLLRDFYKLIVADGVLAHQEQAYYAALQTPEYAGLNGCAFEVLLGRRNRLSFRHLLKTVFPMASKADLASMYLLAFPPQKKGDKIVEPELSMVDRTHIVELFRSFDKDLSGTISFEEFAECSKNLKLPTHAIKKVMDTIDSNSDGVIDLEEFISALKYLYTL